MADYQKELDKYKDTLTTDEKSELQQLAGMQKDIAIGDTAEDFIRHPFFQKFQNQMNAMIEDSKGKILSIETLDDLKAHKAAIAAISDLKKWLNKHVIAGRVARQAISLYEEDTVTMNQKIQVAVDQSKLKQS